MTSRSLCRWTVALGLGFSTGCLHWCHPVEKPALEAVAPCQELPKEARKHVYVFFINGMDPLCFANLGGLHDYVRCLGFPRTYYGQCYHAWHFAHEIRRIHEEDPAARFAIVGFDCGANAAFSVAQAAGKADIPIDLLVYLGGCMLDRGPESRPANVLQLVNVGSSGIQRMSSTPIEGADHVDVADACHYGSPTHSATLCMMARELGEVAARVPVPAVSEVDTIFAPMQVTPNLPPLESAPTPRPVPPQETSERDEWDFLKPVQRLRPPSETIPAAATAPSSTSRASGGYR